MMEAEGRRREEGAGGKERGAHSLHSFVGRGR